MTIGGGRNGERDQILYRGRERLPEIFVKVAEAKRMMQTGEAGHRGRRTRMAGISRSAFYKYKDAVQPFNDMKAEHIITFYCMLKDNTGVLSSVLAVFAASGANILTINQSIPTNGCAAGDHLRRDQRAGGVSGEADGGRVRRGRRDPGGSPGRLTGGRKRA